MEISKKDSNEQNTISTNKYDCSYFAGIQNFKTKPNFKKACLRGKYQTSLGVFGMKVNILRIENNGLKIALHLKNCSDSRIENFALKNEFFKGKTIKEILLNSYVIKDVFTMEVESQNLPKEIEGKEKLNYQISINLKKICPFKFIPNEISFE